MAEDYHHGTLQLVHRRPAELSIL